MLVIPFIAWLYDMEYVFSMVLVFSPPRLIISIIVVPLWLINVIRLHPTFISYIWIRCIRSYNGRQRQRSAGIELKSWIYLRSLLQVCNLALVTLSPSLCVHTPASHSPVWADVFQLCAVDVVPNSISWIWLETTAVLLNGNQTQKPRHNNACTPIYGVDPQGSRQGLVNVVKHVCVLITITTLHFFMCTVVLRGVCPPWQFIIVGLNRVHWAVKPNLLGCVAKSFRACLSPAWLICIYKTCSACIWDISQLSICK